MRHYRTIIHHPRLIGVPVERGRDFFEACLTYEERLQLDTQRAEAWERFQQARRSGQ